MALSFTFAVDKMQAPAIGRAEGHNLRLHKTESQLRPEAWFTPEGRHQVEQWRPEVLAKAKGLAKRKDAVQAIQFVIQLGNQTDWRSEPEPDFPEGRPISSIADPLNLAAKGIRAWVAKEFGDENCVGIDLHTDESTPHFHVVVTPVKNGKLQAKAWLDGPSKLAALRKRAWQAISAHIECEYTPGSPGGAPHDPRKAAGQTPAPTLIDKMIGHAKAQKLERENAALREENAQLKQVLFSRQKGRYSADNVAQAQQATATAQKVQSELQRTQGEVRKLSMDLDKAQGVISRQGAEIDQLKGYNRTLAEQNNALDEKLQELQPRPSRGRGMGL